MNRYKKHTNAVRELKDSCIKLTSLRIYDRELPVRFKTDAFRRAVRAILEYEGYPLAFGSRKTTDVELFGIVHSLKKWRTMLGSKNVTVDTYSATLKRPSSQKNVSPQRGERLDKIADFSLKVKQKPGYSSEVANGLSRLKTLC